MISVIIPVFNAEDYLHVCLNSVLNQTYQDFEIICIDDCSTDSSCEILEYFAYKDNRIKILRNEFHKGLGYSKNVGLGNAKGKYVLFLDSYDWYSLDAFETLVENAEKIQSDVLFFKNDFYNEDSQTFCFPTQMDFLENISPKVFNHYDLDKNDFFSILSFPFNIFYLKSFLEENHIQFSNVRMIQENHSVFCKTILTAKRVSFVNEFMCTHCVGLKVTNHFYNKELRMLINSLYLILDVFLENNKLYSYYKKELFDYIFNELHKIYDNIDSKFKERFYTELHWFMRNLIHKYGLYYDIKENIDETILNKLGFDDVINDLVKPIPKISLIIPVYNVEKYLNECMDSILNQTFKDIEIICVNDGSTDSSLEILESYAKKDSRIKIITQRNCGLGCARNTGLKYAIGDYVWFIDSDDFISENSLNFIYNNATSNNSDIVFFKFSRFNDDEFNYNLSGLPLENIFKDKDYDNFTFVYRDIPEIVLNASFAPWFKVFKREFLDKNNFLFPVGIAYEDVLFNAQSLLIADEISFIPEFLYNYRISNPDSIIHNNSNVWDIFKVCDSVEDFLRDSNFFDEFKSEFFIFKVSQLAQYISFSKDNDYFNQVKMKYLELKKDIDFNLEVFPERFKNVYINVLNSNSLDDFETRYP